MHTILRLPKVDYNNCGRRNCPVEIELGLENGRLSICGSVWNPRRTDIYSGGQNLDEIAGLFPADKRVKRIVEIWDRWHLNDMRAGSPSQMEYLRAHPVTAVYPESHYEKTKAALAAAGLQPDHKHIINGKPYSYGSAWLREELPAEIVVELEQLFGIAQRSAA